MSRFSEHGSPTCPITTFRLIDGTERTAPAYKYLHVCERPDTRPDDRYDWLFFTDAAGWVFLPRERITSVERPADGPCSCPNADPRAFGPDPDCPIDGEVPACSP